MFLNYSFKFLTDDFTSVISDADFVANLACSLAILSADGGPPVTAPVPPPFTTLAWNPDLGGGSMIFAEYKKYTHYGSYCLAHLIIDTSREFQGHIFIEQVVSLYISQLHMHPSHILFFICYLYYPYKLIRV